MPESPAAVKVVPSFELEQGPSVSSAEEEPAVKEDASKRVAWAMLKFKTPDEARLYLVRAKQLRSPLSFLTCHEQARLLRVAASSTTSLRERGVLLGLFAHLPSASQLATELAAAISASSLFTPD